MKRVSTCVPSGKVGPVWGVCWFACGSAVLLGAGGLVVENALPKGSSKACPRLFKEQEATRSTDGTPQIALQGQRVNGSIGRVLLRALLSWFSSFLVTRPHGDGCAASVRWRGGNYHL